MKHVRKRLTYANVMSSVAVFLVLGGATAFAAGQLGKNSVGSKQLKSNAVTSAKIKANAVTTAKIKKGAVTGAKIKLSSLGTVPSSATTEMIRTSKGVLGLNGEATLLQYGPLTVTAKCFTIAGGNLAVQTFIASTTDGTVFTSWQDGSNKLGPATALNERELSAETDVDSGGAFTFEAPADTTFSASAANGQGISGSIGLASEKNSNTCWYWFDGVILG
jgi:hypothetical protein